MKTLKYISTTQIFTLGIGTMLLGCFVTSAQDPPKLDIENSVLLSWPVSSDDYIVLSSAEANGPWIPCLEPIARGPDLFQVAVRTADSAKYFKLAQGTRFMDDFDDGDIEGLRSNSIFPEFEDQITLGFNDGRLRIKSSCPECAERMMWFIPEGLRMADFASSIDILAWDKGTDESPNLLQVGLFARTDPSIVEDPPTVSLMYQGALNISIPEYPGESSIWLWEFTGPYLENQHQRIGEGPHNLPEMNPANDYRLVFYGVGDSLTVELYDLSDLENPLYTLTETDTSLTEGYVGFYVRETWWGGAATIDVTLDNFIVTGTTP